MKKENNNITMKEGSYWFAMFMMLYLGFCIYGISGYFFNKIGTTIISASFMIGIFHHMYNLTNDVRGIKKQMAPMPYNLLYQITKNKKWLRK